MAENYDPVAWFYDKAARFVFGTAIHRAECSFLTYIRPGSTLLIAGGGTGKILEDLTSLFPKGLHIHYVELSENMLSMAEKRNYGANTVIFTHASVEELPADIFYEYILTSFLFDNFCQTRALLIFSHLHAQLKPSGHWINTDFQLTGLLWQKMLLTGMYLFFHLFIGINTFSLPDMDALFNTNGYLLQGEAAYYNHFIGSRLYHKGDQRRS